MQLGYFEFIIAAMNLLKKIILFQQIQLMEEFRCFYFKNILWDLMSHLVVNGNFDICIWETVLSKPFQIVNGFYDVVLTAS
jgi:hypothetical protein